MSQKERDNVMQRFRQGMTKILVATDVAARGLDIEHITHVINFDLPEDLDGYIHRVGRTGRAGRSGMAVSLVEPHQLKLLRSIEHHIGKKMRRTELPSSDAAWQSQKERLLKRLDQASQSPLGIYEQFAQELINSKDARHVLAAALKILTEDEPELESMEYHMEMEEDIPDNMRAHVELPIGRSQGMNPRRLVEMLVSSTSLRAGQIGDIEIQRNCSYVEVPMDNIDEVYAASFKFKGPRRKTAPRTGHQGKGTQEHLN
jgi:ATP-dependent RNA helicase DeaD